MTPLQNIRACVFDAYGTLFDVHSAIGKYRERVVADAERVSTLWRSKQLEYTWLRSHCGVEEPQDLRLDAAAHRFLAGDAIRLH